MCSSTALWGQLYTISTIAGNGTPGFQDATGTSAQMNLPGAIFVTPSGAIYIADGANNRVRMLSNGNVTTIAGNGIPGYAGDGAAATSANLNNPRGVAVDSSGNVYVSDTNNHVVRKITSGGTISTYAGNNGFGAGYAGDGGPANNAQLFYPAGLAFDSSGNLYIADSQNNAIRKVIASNSQITTAVGSGATSGRLSNPTGVAVDSSGNIYIASPGNNRILKYSGGSLSTFAGAGTAAGFSGDGGLAIIAQLADPQGVAVDAAGNVYIADTVNSRIRKVSNGIISTIAGNGVEGYSGDGGPASLAQLYSSHDVAVDKAGNVYIADTDNSVIRELQPSLPTISAGGVANAASYQTQISPGALASVFGTGFGALTASPAASPKLPTISGGVSVTVNGQAAPLYYVSPVQINFQVPWGTAVGNAVVAVTVNGGSSNTVTVQAVSAGPGLFSSNGSAIVQNYPSYSLNTPSNPAPRGSMIIAYLTGSGPVSPTVSDGALSPSNPLATSTASWGATVGSTPAQVSFIGLTPGFVGLVQANVAIPTTLAPGNYPLTVSIGGQTSNAGTISVN